MARHQSKPLAAPDMLQPAEAARFEALDDIVRQHAPRFLEVAAALVTIRAQRLYRQSHGSFEAYLADRGLSRARGNELYDTGLALAVLGGVESVRNADNSLPSGSAIAALVPAVRSAPAQVRPAYDEASRRATERGARGPTEADVRAVVRERVAVPKPTPARRPERRAPEGADDVGETDLDGRTVEKPEPSGAVPSAVPAVEAVPPGWQRFLDFALYCDDKLPAALGQLAFRQRGRDRLHRLREFIDAADDVARSL